MGIIGNNGKNKEISDKEREFLELVAAGTPKPDALLETGELRPWDKKNIKKLRKSQKLQEVIEDRIGLERVVHLLNDGLTATQYVRDSSGELIDTGEPDHKTRHTYLDTYIKVTGDYASKKIDLDTTTSGQISVNINTGSAAPAANIIDVTPQPAALPGIVEDGEEDAD